MALSIDKARSETRFSAIASAVLLVLVVAIPSRFWSALISLPLIITAWLLLFHGTTWVSLRLQGIHQKTFQISVALLVPLVLSLYFIHRTPQVTAAGVLEPLLDAWYLIPMAIIGYVSWFAAAQLDREHPFRGFLIAAAILFIICLFGYWGIRSEYDEQSESSLRYVDKEAAARAAQSGRYFAQYLIYVAIAYGVMVVRFKKRHT
jgi:hypothetical protein